MSIIKLLFYQSVFAVMHRDGYKHTQLRYKVNRNVSDNFKYILTREALYSITLSANNQCNVILLDNICLADTKQLLIMAFVFLLSQRIPVLYGSQ